MITVLIAMGFAVGTYGRQAGTQDTLPAKITEDFSSKFANASAIEWNIADSLYTGTFTLDGERHIIEYHPSGRIQMHRYALKENQYPQMALETIKSDFNGYRIADFDYVERDNVVTYEAKLKGKPDYIVSFDTSGKFISKKED